MGTRNGGEWQWGAFFFSLMPSKVAPQSLGRYQTVPGLYPLPLKCNTLGGEQRSCPGTHGLDPAMNACFVHVKKSERRAECVEISPHLEKEILAQSRREQSSCKSCSISIAIY